MKKILFLLIVALSITSCGLVDISNAEKQKNFERESKSVRYSSEYATTINKLELNEANFNLAKQRDLLLPRLMSGKLEVK